MRQRDELNAILDRRLRARRLGGRVSLASAALAIAFSTVASAHKPSDSYLSLDATSMQGSWDIALRDLDDAIGVDADGNGAVTWGELRQRESVLTAWAFSRLAVKSDGAACKLQPLGLAVDDLSDGAYAVLRFSLGCARPKATLSVQYSLLFDLDPTHRGLLRVISAAGVTSAVLGPDTASANISIAAPGALHFAAQGALALFKQVWAMFILVALLLRRYPRKERVATVVSFALALSIVLVLSGLLTSLHPAPRVLQAAVPLSLVLVALNLAWPLLRERLWALSFALGLLHGFDFAQRFAAIPLAGASVARALPGFNLGLVVTITAITLLVSAIGEAVQSGLRAPREYARAGSSSQ